MVDDRNALVALWEGMKLPSGDLEKRLTEFQVAATDEGQILGALGVRILGKQAMVHSEAFLDFSQADTLREALWERAQSLANNHGLVRLWTLEQAPFWRRSGLSAAGTEELEKLPQEWSHLGASWLTLKLREDVEEVLNLDKEFALFMESERDRSRQMMDQAKMLKLLATLLAIGLFVIVIGFGFYFVSKNPGLIGR